MFVTVMLGFGGCWCGVGHLEAAGNDNGQGGGGLEFLRKNDEKRDKLKEITVCTSNDSRAQMIIEQSYAIAFQNYFHLDLILYFKKSSNC